MISIPLLRLIITLEAKEDSTLPEFKGSTIRGAFGRSLFGHSCLIDLSQCRSNCPYGDRCAHGYLFETPDLPPDGHVNPGRPPRKLPHPFVFSLGKERQTEFAPEDRLTFHLTLLGKGIDYLPQTIFALSEATEHGLGVERSSFILRQVAAKNTDGHSVVLFQDGKPVTESRLPSIAFSLSDVLFEADSSQEITLEFLTNTRLKEKKGFAKSTDFPGFANTLINRIAELARYHCQSEVPKNVKEQYQRLAHEVQTHSSHLHWNRLERYTSRQIQKNSMGGFRGRITFRGPIAPFLPWIQLGTYIHIGKGTAYGLGQFRIVRYLDNFSDVR